MLYESAQAAALTTEGGPIGSGSIPALTLRLVQSNGTGVGQPSGDLNGIIATGDRMGSISTSTCAQHALGTMRAARFRGLAGVNELLEIYGPELRLVTCRIELQNLGLIKHPIYLRVDDNVPPGTVRLGGDFLAEFALMINYPQGWFLLAKRNSIPAFLMSFFFQPVPRL